LLETLFSISGFPGSGALTSEEIQAGGAAGNPQGVFSRAKIDAISGI
jgi:hypothetical protein